MANGSEYTVHADGQLIRVPNNVAGWRYGRGDNCNEMVSELRAQILRVTEGEEAKAERKTVDVGRGLKRQFERNIIAY